MEVRSPSDTYHILYKHDTSKVSITLLTQMLPPSLTLLVVKCVIPFMLLIQQREIKLCLSVRLITGTFVVPMVSITKSA